MNVRHFASFALCFGFAAVVGCNNKPAPVAPPSTKTPHADHEDHGPGPHKGVIGEWSHGKHIEFTVDHGKQEATVYVLRGNAKDSSPIKTDKLMLTIKEPSFQVELKAQPEPTEPEGYASRFVGKDERFGKEQEFAGTVEGTADGKTYKGEFEEKPEKK